MIMHEKKVTPIFGIDALLTLFFFILNHIGQQILFAQKSK